MIFTLQAIRRLARVGALDGPDRGAAIGFLHWIASEFGPYRHPAEIGDDAARVWACMERRVTEHWLRVLRTEAATGRPAPELRERAAAVAAHVGRAIGLASDRCGPETVLARLALGIDAPDAADAYHRHLDGAA